MQFLAPKKTRFSSNVPFPISYKFLFMYIHYIYINPCIIISSSPFLILFILFTHSICSCIFNASVTPCYSESAPPATLPFLWLLNQPTSDARSTSQSIPDTDTLQTCIPSRTISASFHISHMWVLLH